MNSRAHVAGMILSGLAFALFVVNQIAELAGKHISFDGITGAVILGVFLACGLLVQAWKWAEGSKSQLDGIITFVSLLVHIAAEVIIWSRTRILEVGLPEHLPMLIVGGYWLTGVVEVIFRNGERQWAVIKGDYKSPEEQLQQQIVLLQQQRFHDQEDRAKVEQSWQQRLAELEKQRALLEHSLSTAQAMLQQSQAELEKRDRQLERVNERIQKADEQKNKKYEVVCEQCEWTSGEKESLRSAEYALRAHVGVKHKNGYRSTEIISGS